MIEITDQVLSTSGGRPDAIVFEITENMLAQDPVKTPEILRRLADKGYQLALDDLATGALSLSFLQKLPISELKIDRSFVTAMTRTRTRRPWCDRHCRSARALACGSWPRA